jgi:hypothetical protein
MKAVIFLFCIWNVLPLHAQIRDPIQWTFGAKKISGTTYELHLTGAIDPAWHIYSQTTPDGGPVATVISFSANPLVGLDGKTTDVGMLQQHFEKLFGVVVKQFSDSIDFVQKVTLKKPVKTNIGGTIRFMICNDHQCLPPTTIPFSIPLP